MSTVITFVKDDKEEGGDEKKDFNVNSKGDGIIIE